MKGFWVAAKYVEMGIEKGFTVWVEDKGSLRDKLDEWNVDPSSFTELNVNGFDTPSHWVYE